MDFHAQSLGDDLGRLGRPAKVAAVQDINLPTGKSIGNSLRLGQPHFIQRRFHVPLLLADGIPDRLAMTDDQDSGCFRLAQLHHLVSGHDDASGEELGQAELPRRVPRRPKNT
jgi:hypothetical protein